LVNSNPIKSSILIHVFQTQCADVFSGCDVWLVPPNINSMIIFPPPSALPRFNLHHDLYNDYSNLTGLGLQNNVMLVVTQMSAGNTRSYSTDTFVNVRHFLSLYLFQNQINFL
jgi:hypothetical protein